MGDIALLAFQMTSVARTVHMHQESGYIPFLLTQLQESCGSNSSESTDLILEKIPTTETCPLVFCPFHGDVLHKETHPN